MKAKEYYNKYQEALSAAKTYEEIATIVNAIFLDFIKEAEELIKTRHISTDDGVLSLISELNNKWNALDRICTKNGMHYIVTDGFKKYWEFQGIKTKAVIYGS